MPSSSWSARLGLAASELPLRSAPLSQLNIQACPCAAVSSRQLTTSSAIYSWKPAQRERNSKALLLLSSLHTNRCIMSSGKLCAAPTLPENSQGQLLSRLVGTDDWMHAAVVALGAATFSAQV